MNTNKINDPMGYLENDADSYTEDAQAADKNFLLKVGDGLRLYDRIYKVTAIRDDGERIILKRAHNIRLQ